FNTERREVILTELGRQAICAYLGIDDQVTVGSGSQAALPFGRRDYLPALSYTDSEGKGHLLVFPFMREMADLEGYVLPRRVSESQSSSRDNLYATLTVKVEAQALSPRAQNESTDLMNLGGLLGSITYTLGGGEQGGDRETKTLTVLEQRLTLSELSLDAIDVSFARNDQGEWLAYSLTPQGMQPGNRVLSPEDYRPLKVTISVEAGSLKHDHELKVSEEQPLDKLFCTIGLNSSDLSPSAVSAIDDAVARSQAGVTKPDAQSYLQLYHRVSLFTFLASQTAAEDSLAEGMGLVLGRSSTSRLIILTTRQNAAGNLVTSIDLAQPFNEIHNANNAAAETIHGFNIASGLMMCELERDCLQGANAVGYMELWELLPVDEDGNRDILLIPPDRQPRRAILAEMEAQGGYPQRLLETIGNSSRVILTPTQAVEHNGRQRWAWLEIDSETYQTISVFEDGSHGAFVEYLVVINSMDFAKGTVAGFYCGFVTTGFFFAGFVVESLDADVAKVNAQSAASVLSAGMNVYTGGAADALGAMVGLFGSQAQGLAASIINGIRSAGGNSPLIGGFVMGFDLGSAAFLNMLTN
ncbi:MAG: hypothetical protein FWE76_07775, partial [Symbiobacteriaceae bacterium]|nr:hypothetical protein [Symbiobacteriaceae bacterium]